MDKAQSAEGAVESAQTAPETGAVEQKVPSYQDALIALAKEEGSIAKDTVTESPAQPETVVDQPEEVTEPVQAEQPELPIEEIGDEVEEPEKPAAEGDLWPQSAKVRVAEESEKRRRANERADRAEAETAKREERIAELERSLAQAYGPQPDKDNPVVDIYDPKVLDRFEKIYEDIVDIDRSELNEDGMIDIVVARDQQGNPVRRQFTPEKFEVLQKRADRAIHKYIPRRREYLEGRQHYDGGAQEFYPDLANKEHPFTQSVEQLLAEVTSGRAMSNPQVKFWVANAIYGYNKRLEEAKAFESAKADPVKQVVASAQTKIAPTAPRTRASGERKPGVDLAKAREKFMQNKGSEEAELAYLRALRSQRSQTNKIQPVAE